jgi:hypothetical protein
MAHPPDAAGYLTVARKRTEYDDGSASGPSQRPADALPGVAGAFCSLALHFLSVACYPPASDRISCDGALPPGEASFNRLSALALDPLKGCAADGCHSGDGPQRGLRLDRAALIYEEFSTNADVVYALLASGKMPDGGVRWDDDDLRMFRSWYCDGAFPP